VTLPLIIVILQLIIVFTMFSDIREDGRSYESSSNSDLNDESTTHHENPFLQPTYTSTNFDITSISDDGHAAEISDVAERVRKVLDFMSTVDLDLTGFLDALSWGDISCFNDPKIRYARSSLLKSQRLPIILYRWWKPLRTPGSHNKRPDGATETMQNFALTCLEEIYVKEINNLSKS
jgi:hypothetical protein